jgi:hypothetical protein
MERTRDARSDASVWCAVEMGARPESQLTRRRAPVRSSLQRSAEHVRHHTGCLGADARHRASPQRSSHEQLEA